MKKLFVIIPLLSVLLMTACKEEAETVEERIEPVKVKKLELRSFERITTLSVVLQGYETQNVSPSVTGIIKKIYVEESSRVKKGDDLVMMDEMQYNTAKLTFANLGVELARLEALLKTGSATKQAYDNLKTQYDQTKENLEFLKANTYVKAGFSGVVSAKNYEDGELYNGQPILTLTQISTLKAEVNVPEGYFPQIKEGMKIDIVSDIYPNINFPAIIEKVFPTIDPSSHTFTIKVKIPNSSEKLRPGMYTQARLRLGLDSAIVVPYQTVLKLQGSNVRYVFVNQNGKARRVAVKMGQRFDDEVELISDELKVGDELVVEGEARLVDGSKLEIQK
ncbi:MAG: efflux RND transporter periplasmic adaptor subunit [bacterium]|nr:efflux RND transporter periplasmic adaptor subunit [Candidatus Minthenecus merdequi]